MLRPAASSRVERSEGERKTNNSEHVQHEEHQVVACKINSKQVSARARALLLYIVLTTENLSMLNASLIFLQKTYSRRIEKIVDATEKFKILNTWKKWRCLTLLSPWESTSKNAINMIRWSAFFPEENVIKKTCTGFALSTNWASGPRKINTTIWRTEIITVCNRKYFGSYNACSGTNLDNVVKWYIFPHVVAILGM